MEHAKHVHEGGKAQGLRAHDKGLSPLALEDKSQAKGPPQAKKNAETSLSLSFSM